MARYGTDCKRLKDRKQNGARGLVGTPLCRCAWEVFSPRQWLSASLWPPHPCQLSPTEQGCDPVGLSMS